MKLESAESGRLLVYHGSNNGPGVQHLTRKGLDKTLCGRVEVDRTRTGKVNMNKASSFNGLDSVLGTVCSWCKEKYLEQEGGDEGLE